MTSRLKRSCQDDRNLSQRCQSKGMIVVRHFSKMSVQFLDHQKAIKRGRGQIAVPSSRSTSANRRSGPRTVTPLSAWRLNLNELAADPGLRSQLSDVGRAFCIGLRGTRRRQGLAQITAGTLLSKNSNFSSMSLPLHHAKLYERKRSSIIFLAARRQRKIRPPLE